MWTSWRSLGRCWPTPSWRESSFWRAIPTGGRVGFATIFWTWSTLSAARIGVMNDLFVARAGARVGGG